MTLIRISGPTVYPVTLDEAEANSRIEPGGQDLHLLGLIAAATARVETETGRAFSEQTWEWVMDAFPAGEIVIPAGPIKSVISVIYTDAAGNQVTVPEADYRVDTVSDDGRVIPVSGWPAAGPGPNAVRVRFVLGQDCPADVKQAILLLVGHWTQNREDASEEGLRSIPYGVKALLGLHRRMFV